jgi:hypothetical protein
VLVWRVENQYKLGPYIGVYFNHDNIWQDMLINHRDDNHPDIKYDVPDRNLITPKHVCGFTTKEYALKWFAGYLEFLETLGFNLVQVGANPSSVLYGEGPFGQIAFIPAEVTHER